MPKIIERIDEDEKEYKILAPNNFAHKAGDGIKTRKRTIKDIVPSICANPGSSQMSYVLEIIKDKDDNCNKGNKTMKRIRKLTPCECWKLMGFTAEDHNKVEEAGISATQRYKQAGNSIVVNVLEGIFRELGEIYDEFKGGITNDTADVSKENIKTE